MIPDDLQQFDFRANLICDANNPILIQKAWRDRFSDASHWRAGYGGTAYLSRPNSEDALTWNVFRTLQSSGDAGLALVSEIFDIPDVERLLFWGCDVENHGDLQQLINILIRTTDGRLRGTMTEADLVIIAKQAVVFCECKLNNNGSTSPWAAQGEGAQKRMIVYRERLPDITQIVDWQKVYQLIRQYVYARLLGDALKKTPVVISLINDVHSRILDLHYEPLRSATETTRQVFRPMLTWQAAKNKIESTDLPVAIQIVGKIDQALNAAR